ncbi:hypothetical protein GH714_024486 [Hevea brasiliensis]|uniref:F-actin-capping protein subunit beta n=1 Tax=Hevea brasiliensis TaxID=3981 RepID=A0A6A6LD00_HEVBR|nr:hypothetical protein GH714_024486 [Hevea brasiliensis]
MKVASHLYTCGKMIIKKIAVTFERIKTAQKQGRAEGVTCRRELGTPFMLLRRARREEGAAHILLTSTVMLSLTTNGESSGTFSLSGSIRRQMNMDLAIADGHLCNMGRMIEEMEGKLRNSLDQESDPFCALP